MDALPVPDCSYVSPKRKRGEAAPGIFSPLASPSAKRIETDFSHYSFPEIQADTHEGTGDGSPQSKVAGRLRMLDLEGDFDKDDVGQTPKRLAQMTIQDAESSEQKGEAFRRSFHSTSLDTVEGDHVESSSVTERPQRYTRSPPLDGERNETFWSESEITGHKPTDPNDDGYGINGIGFMPTPAMAWARSQRRKQQVAEYKSREAREARQRRYERRRMPEPQEQTGETPEIVEKRRSRVRFEEHNRGETDP